MSLLAISPIDGRYANKTNTLIDFFSEKALFQYRVKVEIEYFIALCKVPLPQLQEVDSTAFKSLRSIYKDFTTDRCTNN